MDHTLKRAIVGAGVFGFGFSGLVDVLLLHHALQLHHLLSNRIDPTTLTGLRANLLADGLFSLLMLTIMSVGAGLVWVAERRRSGPPLPVQPVAGAAIVGLGVFDLFDVVVNHTLLGLHHATSGPGFYDPHWALVSLLIIGAGVYVYRHGTAELSPGESGE